jgi:hypothetical protein
MARIQHRSVLHEMRGDLRLVFTLPDKCVPWVRTQSDAKRQKSSFSLPQGRPSQQGQRVQQTQQVGVWQQHRTWQQRGGYSGYRIPTTTFSVDFGRSHGFHLYSMPLVIFGGYPSFQYGGYWFSILDPIPEYWGANWYETDDVYIDNSEDGYYLYDTRYPQDQITVAAYTN